MSGITDAAGRTAGLAEGDTGRTAGLAGGGTGRTPPAAEGLVRSMDGPFVLRVCVRTPSGYRWVEQDKRRNPCYLDAGRLDALRAVLPQDAAVLAAVPTLSASGLATWPPLPTPALLCDRAYVAARGDLERVCRALGGFLSLLHAAPPADLPRRSAPAWLPEGSWAAWAVETVRRRLPGGRLARAAAAVTPFAGDPVVVHGRFSTGVCADTDRPAVLGWREAGLGDPLRDLAFFLAELVEAAALIESADDPAATAFLDGYGAVADADRLVGLVADRLLEHCAQSMVWRPAGHAAGGDPEVALPRLEAYWRRFATAVTA
ncbi:phosphotransferase [Nonomuraea fuscirosea]|uniref:phosphotransferase n=1 Tax=Nonomuraea fuscirosea TaxID=1291556 RepID=UPI00379C41B3